MIELKMDKIFKEKKWEGEINMSLDIDNNKNPFRLDMVDHASYFDVFDRYREEEKPILVQTNSGIKIGNCTVIEVHRMCDNASDQLSVSMILKVDTDKQNLFKSGDRFAFSVNAMISQDTRKIEEINHINIDWISSLNRDGRER